MLTPEQIAAIRDQAGRLTDPVQEFLLRDIARRVAKAGQLTSTAQYQIWRAQQMGLTQEEIKTEVQRLLGVSRQEMEQLLTQAAEVGYNFDLDRLPTAGAASFAENEALQRIVQASVQLAGDDFSNITQTLGMIDPLGNPLPLRDAYTASMDYAFELVSTGAADYNTAVRMATHNLAVKGLVTIDYASGVHTSLEAAVRRSLMGGLGLMVEQTQQLTHDQLGCNGWEISAHAASAPDHEPIQGHQYTDAQFQALNDSLQRRIGTLNCGHIAFPIILGVNQPQYSRQELEEMRSDNDQGVTYEGKQYTKYEATQLQRRLERAMRVQKRRVLVSEATGDVEKLTVQQIRLQRQSAEYKRFSKAVGLRTERERIQKAGFGRAQASQAARAVKTAAMRKKNLDAARELRYNQVRAEARQVILSPETPKKVNIGSQNKHIITSKGFIKGRSYIYGGVTEAQALVDQYAGTGEIKLTSKGEWSRKEFVTADHVIGVCVDPATGKEVETRRFSIHYGKKGTHIVPAKEEVQP